MFKKILNKINSNHVYRDLVVWGIIGAIATVLDIGTLNIFYRFVHTNIFVATLMGFLAGTVFGYPANNSWTYGRHGQKAHLAGLFKITVVGACGLLFTEIIMYVLTIRMGYNYNVSKLVAVVIVFFWNFFANRYWTFKAPKVVEV